MICPAMKEKGKKEMRNLAFKNAKLSTFYRYTRNSQKYMGWDEHWSQ